MPICTPEDLYGYNNLKRIGSIVYELRRGDDDGSRSLFSISSNPQNGRISLEKLYMTFCVDDPTEVTFAEEVFGDLEFWLEMRESSRMKPYVEQWQHMAAIRRKQKAFKTIVAEIEEKGKNSYQAAKYLIEEPWVTGTTAAERKKARKRVSETAEEAFQAKQIQEDVLRLKEEGILN